MKKAMLYVGTNDTTCVAELDQEKVCCRSGSRRLGRQPHRLLRWASSSGRTRLRDATVLLDTVRVSDDEIAERSNRLVLNSMLLEEDSHIGV